MTDEIKNAGGLASGRGPAQPKDVKKPKEKAPEGTPGLGGRGGDARTGARGGQR